MATYTDIKDLIDANLASGTKIPAIKHREVEMALLDYIEANFYFTSPKNGLTPTFKKDKKYKITIKEV